MSMTPALLERLKARTRTLGPAVYAAVLALVLLALCGAVGVGLHQPWVFPSLGPTVMLFFESPEQPASRPANALVGHFTGLGMGIACLYAFGLQERPSAPVGGLTEGHVAAAALSVALTTFLLTMLRRPHPPAGATTLIVSLGILTTPPQLGSMAGAVLLTTAAGWGMNILLGTKPAAGPPASP